MAGLTMSALCAALGTGMTKERARFLADKSERQLGKLSRVDSWSAG